jgi:PAS domain S-box-containing protein
LLTILSLILIAPNQDPVQEKEQEAKRRHGVAFSDIQSPPIGTVQPLTYARPPIPCDAHLVISTLPMPDLAQQIADLYPGDHLCLFYTDDPAEQMPALLPFIRDALRQDERFIYIADDQTTDQFVARLEVSGINVAQEIQRERLKLGTRNGWRQPGELSPEQMSHQVGRLLQESAAAGFKGTRFAVEMTRILGPNIDFRALEKWEATINAIFTPGTPGRIICQYNRSQLPPEAALAALHTHPLAILSDEVYPNFFYRAPLIPSPDSDNDGGRNAEANVNWMISQLARSREAGRQREEKASQQLAAIVSHSNDAIFSMTLEGVITSWNTGAERLYGYTATEIIGQHIIKLVPKVIHDEEPAILERTRRGELIEHYETVRQRKDGTIVDISLTVSPIKDRHGNIVGISKTARDITDKKRAEETLRRQHRELAELDSKKNEFLAMLGHELRNPLAAIQNAAELLGEESEASTQLWATGVVRRQIALLARLVDDLVDVSRITRGRIELRRDNVDICPILRRAIETARPLIEERRHTIELSHPHDTLLVSADSARLEQLLVNLLTNSAKYTDPEGLIQLSATRTRDQVVVAVKDNGIGIAPDLLSHIFELFVQDKRGLDRSRGGLGIGLALSRRLAELHGGTLSAASDGPGCGSIFTLVIPSLPTHAHLPASHHAPAARSNGNGTPRRILLVDDNKDSAQSISKLLERRGHLVRVVHDGITALKIAYDFAPDTFLLDLGLPGMDGYELSRKLHRTGFANALFIAISGYAQPQDIDHSRIAGFQHHLAKPVDIERIKEVLANCSGGL